MPSHGLWLLIEQRGYRPSPVRVDYREARVSWIPYEISLWCIRVFILHNDITAHLCVLLYSSISVRHHAAPLGAECTPQILACGSLLRCVGGGDFPTLMRCCSVTLIGAHLSISVAVVIRFPPYCFILLCDVDLFLASLSTSLSLPQALVVEARLGSQKVTWFLDANGVVAQGCFKMSR